MQSKIINWSELSKFLSRNRGAVRKNNIPKKYKERIDRLEFYISAWEKGILLTSEEEFNRKLKEINLFKAVIGEE